MEWKFHEKYCYKRINEAEVIGLGYRDRERNFFNNKQSKSNEREV